MQVCVFRGGPAGGLIVGQALAGFLFGISRVLPFIVDACSYLVSVITVLLIRTPLQEEGSRRRQRLQAEIGEGFGWLWQQRFLRTTALLVTGSDLVVNALYLAVIVIARQRGASSPLIGAMLALVGIAGFLGSLIATRLRRLLSVRAVIISTLAVEAVLTPLLAFVANPLAMGLIYGGMFVLHPTWGSVVGPYQITLVPDHLQARGQSVILILSLAAIPIGSLAVGVLLQAVGATPTVLGLAGLMAVVALAAVVSRSVRQPPP